MSRSRTVPALVAVGRLYAEWAFSRGPSSFVARFSASASVSATIGRKVTQNRSFSVRPASRAAAWTCSICCRVSARGSPQSAKMSAWRPPAPNAYSEDPPSDTGSGPPE